MPIASAYASSAKVMPPKAIGAIGVIPFAVIKTAKLFRLFNHPLPNSQAEANITWHIPIFHCYLPQPGYIIYHTI